MIQNVLIINRGLPWVVENFGQCHTIDTKSSLFTGFLEAFIDFSIEISESKMKSINFEDVTISLKVSNDLLFVIIANVGDNLEFLNKKMDTIINLFFEQFKDDLKDDPKSLDAYKGFRKTLIDVGVVSKICDSEESCEYCPTVEEEEKLGKIYSKIQDLANKLSN